MIHPSYTELIEAINTNSEDDDTTMSLNSRYSLVLAASKRARQIIAGSKPMVEGAAGKKPLSVAIDELYKGKVKILLRKKRMKKEQNRQLRHRQKKFQKNQHRLLKPQKLLKQQKKQYLRKQLNSNDKQTHVSENYRGIFSGTFL